jgi:ribose transport system permease protein
MTTTKRTAAGTTPKRPTRFGNRQQLQQLLAFAGLVVIFGFFSFASPYFLDWGNVKGILLATAVTGIMALGATLVIATGGIDLSVGTGMTLCSVMTAVFLANLGLPLAIGVLGGLAIGALIGLVNGLNVSYLRLPPFIATLATMMIAQGLSLVISGTKPIYFSDVAGFDQIAAGELIPGLPNAVLIFFVAAAIAGVVLSKTLTGRYALSIGSNEEATAISGVNVRRWKVVIYTVAGLFTGLAGVVLGSRLNSAQPGLGLGYELEAIAAVVIGGTSLRGGKATILGTVIGALIMATLTNGLRIMSIPQEWQRVAVGIVIILAVYADQLRRGKEA